MSRTWDFKELDESIAQSLNDFIPSRVFDVHVHIYRSRDIPAGYDLYKGVQEVTKEVWFERQEKQLGEHKLAGGLFVSTTFFYSRLTDLQPANDYLFEQVAAHPGYKGLLGVGPASPVEGVLEMIKTGLVAGFKPFCTFSGLDVPYQAPMHTYVPEWMWELADHYGLVFLVHLVRDKALSDPENYLWIRKMCSKYPRAKLLLDHAARGFHGPNTVEGVRLISGLDNVYFDTSCICESAPLIAILQEFGTERLMYGSDFPLSQVRGKTATLGDGFIWLDTETVDWSRMYGKPTLVGLESLRAVREAVRLLNIGDKGVENIFYNSAMDFLNLE